MGLLIGEKRIDGSRKLTEERALKFPMKQRAKNTESLWSESHMAGITHGHQASCLIGVLEKKDVQVEIEGYIKEENKAGF